MRLIIARRPPPASLPSHPTLPRWRGARPRKGPLPFQVGSGLQSTQPQRTPRYRLPVLAHCQKKTRLTLATNCRAASSRSASSARSSARGTCGRRGWSRVMIQRITVSPRPSPASRTTPLRSPCPAARSRCASTRPWPAGARARAGDDAAVGLAVGEGGHSPHRPRLHSDVDGIILVNMSLTVTVTHSQASILKSVLLEARSKYPDNRELESLIARAEAVSWAFSQMAESRVKAARAEVAAAEAMMAQVGA